jgi:hypothetical protein
METQPGVRYAVTAQDLQQKIYTEGQLAKLQRGFHPDRSGDVMLVYEPGIYPTSDFRTPVSKVRGTSHGSGYAYDTQVPMLWFGKGVKRGDSSRKVHPRDIAPTLSFMLNLQMPDGTSGNPLKELLD